MQTTSDSQCEPVTMDSRPDESPLLSLEEYHLLVKQLASQIETLEQSRDKLQTQCDSARRKLRVQHRLIKHLRERLEIVTGLDIHSDEAADLLPVESRRKASRPLSLGRAVSRFRTDHREAAAERDGEETIPAIDPAEFLPIDDSMFDSVWVRRLRAAARRCRGFVAACAVPFEHTYHSQSSRART